MVSAGCRSRLSGGWFRRPSFRFVSSGIGPGSLTNHEECSDEVKFVVLSDVVVELFEFDNSSSIVLNTRGIHVVFKSPE